MVIEDLADISVPGYLLAILVPYLPGQSMTMRYDGATSSRQLLPGSTLQGTFLGILLLIVIFNGALLRPAIPRPTSLHLKYIDCLYLLLVIDLRKTLANDLLNRARPLKFDE